MIGIISYHLVTLNAFWPFWPCSSQKGLSSLLYIVCMCVCALVTAETAFSSLRRRLTKSSLLQRFCTEGWSCSRSERAPKAVVSLAIPASEEQTRHSSAFTKRRPLSLFVIVRIRIFLLCSKCEGSRIVLGVLLKLLVKV